jgi:glycosyltransferase involved in cell wall biosynthesis
LSESELTVDYTLPLAIKPGAHWTTVLGSRTAFHPGGTIFLLAGTQVPEHWDARLAAAGQRAPDAIAIAPLCARHPIFSAFTNSDHEPGLEVDGVDQWLNDYASGIEFTVPVMLESCLLLQSDFWTPETVRAGDDRKLFDLLRVKGKTVLATDQVYIDDTSAIYSRDISFLPSAILTAYTQRHPLTDVRHALTELSARAERPAELRHCLPVVVHVGHSWGGGLGRWIESYINADPLHHHLVLRSIGDRTAFGQQIALYPGAEMRVPLRSWTLAEPIQSTVIAQYEYQHLMAEIINDFNVEALIVSSLIGHSLDLLRTDLPITYVLHDFFPYCPALYATYTNPCRSCQPDELALCAKSNPLHSYFKLESDQHWLEVRSTFLSLIANSRISLVSPSKSVIDRYVTLEESMRLLDIRVIEHGLSSAMVGSLTSVREAANPGIRDRLRIVVPGRVTQEKGGDLLAELIEAITSFSDVWLLGAGESGRRFAGMPHVTVVDEYAMRDLSAYLVTIDPHLGLLLSVVPETFSYTLSEMWAAGIPVVATQLGAFRDRIKNGENGWLVPLDAEQVRAVLTQINGDREALNRVKTHVMQQSIRSAAEMVTDYHLLGAGDEHIPLKRYYLPRKTHRNPYRNPAIDERDSVLYIDRQATYRAVLREFLQFTRQKVDQTPRMSGIFRLLLRRMIDAWILVLSSKKIKK